MGVRVKMEIDDQVSDQLRRLGAVSNQMLDNVLFSASLAGKKRVQGGMRRVLHERTGKMMKGVKFRRTSRGRFRLKGPNLGSVYEFNGAEIFPKDKPFLQWQDRSGHYYRSNWVTIEPRPFFYSSMREFLATGEMDRVMQARIDYEIKANKVKL